MAHGFRPQTGLSTGKQCLRASIRTSFAGYGPKKPLGSAAIYWRLSRKDHHAKHLHAFCTGIDAVATNGMGASCPAMGTGRDHAFFQKPTR